MKKYILPSLFLALTTFTYAQQNYFKAHEWGTFTTLQNSDGYRLSGLHVDEERLPVFVKNIAYSKDSVIDGNKGFTRWTTLKGVTVKMETPVIYFYSNDKKDVSVSVNFKGGAISQWFPERTDGEAKEFQPIVDFTKPKNGWIKWNTTVLAPSETGNNTLPEANAFPQWTSPRNTNSNLIKGADNVAEKFLFYRGIANFAVPVKVEFNTYGNLVITNNDTKELGYVLVYDKQKGEQANIWWAGTIKGRYIKVVAKPKNTIDAEGLKNEMAGFENGLVKAGLYQDEAKAMLDTWNKSYFEHDGLRVFWVASRSFVDEVLPISIQPQPEELQRVIVGRSEILTPEFEDELRTSISKYTTDRFYNAYLESNKRTAAALTTINQDSSLDPTGIDKTDSSPFVRVFPNPADQTITLSFLSQRIDNLDIRLFNVIGEEVIKVNETARIDQFTRSINISDLPPGIYLLNLRSSNNWSYSSKFIKE